MMNVVFYIVLGVHVIASLLLILTVLLQRPKSEGLGASFGGAITDSVFGAQTSEVLVKATVWLGAIVLTATLVLGIIYSHISVRSGISEKVLGAPDRNEVPAVPTAVPSASDNAQQKTDAQQAAATTPATDSKK